MAKTYYLFRHGLATRSITGYGDTILSAPILPEAIPIVKKMASFLSNIQSDYNVSSPLTRCRQTVTIISRITKKHFVFDHRLSEFYQETFDKLRARVYDFLSDPIVYKSQSIVICSHGAVIAGLTHFIVKELFRQKDFYDFPSIGEMIIIKDKIIKKLNFN